MQITLTATNKANMRSCRLLKIRKSDTNFSIIKKELLDKLWVFDYLKRKLLLFNNCIEREVPNDLHIKMCDFHTNSFYQTKKYDVPEKYESFWKLISKEHSPKPFKFSLHIYYMVKGDRLLAIVDVLLN